MKISFSWVLGLDFGVDKEAIFRLLIVIDDSGTRDEGRERLSMRTLCAGVMRSTAVSDIALSTTAELASKAEEVVSHWPDFDRAAALFSTLASATGTESSVALDGRRSGLGWNKSIFELGEDDASAGFSSELLLWTKGVPCASGLDENRDSKDVGSSWLRRCGRRLGGTAMSPTPLDGVP